jgi:hypothetical protein
MSSPMADGTQGNEVVLCIVAELTSFGQMVDVQLFRGTTILTSPPISFEHMVA